ncbi:hypothetical protein [Rubritalea tangerina]|uniref:hypothetical protein n=1 Tax=Rubritalea tangerina TaxID=430798 RepID=UPI00361F099C
MHRFHIFGHLVDARIVHSVQLNRSNDAETIIVRSEIASNLYTVSGTLWII